MQVGRPTAVGRIRPGGRPPRCHHFALQIADAVSTCSANPVPTVDTCPVPPSAELAGAPTLAELLGNLDEVSAARLPERHIEDHLIRSRLGVVSALFTALRAKHPPTARHALRVALRCSLIAELVQLDRATLDHLEVAALLHDVGKIAVPDQLLNKAGPLMADEMEVMRQQRGDGLEILTACRVPDAVLDIVRFGSEPYDGQDGQPDAPVGQQIPLGARILAIADAFDAMTTERVYRPAMSRERAVSELFAAAGTQFDPELVERFAWLSPQTETEIQRRVSLRWLQPLATDWAERPGEPIDPQGSSETRDRVLGFFQQRLLDSMQEGVVFLDARWRVLLWNAGAERLTGRSAESVLDKAWHLDLFDLRDTEGNRLGNTRCPVQQVFADGVPTRHRATITRSSGERVAVELQVIPVSHKERGFGAALLLRDVSSESNLEARVHDLREQATTDPLTGVGNRAEFDHAQAVLMETCLRQGTTFSIILSDLDRFKQVNDVFGHQAGDEVLVDFANLLRRWSRKDDLVARYGGEEFVILCPECDNATAAQRAEQIRNEWAQTLRPMLNQTSVTASFGVTELQAGDTVDTMLRRVDRALYQAKDGGRNRVVQLGAGFLPAEEKSSRGWLSWLQRRPLRSLIQRTLITNVPLNVAAEKIRGFIADHEAEIVSIEDNQILLAVDVAHFEPRRRRSDRPTTLMIDLQVCEVPPESTLQGGYHGTRTMARVTIRPRRGRDRRTHAEQQATLILTSLKSYLIAQECAGL